MNDTTNIDNLLDIALDDLADLPEFKTYPNGAHRVTISFEKKEVNNHPCVELKMKALETLELSDAAKDQPLEAGTESSVLYMLDNEFGQGKFKEICKPLGQHLGVAKLSEIIAGANGMEVVIVTKVRQNKDKSQSYTDVVSLAVV